MNRKSSLISAQKTVTQSGLYLFAVPWLVIGIQHYMYADFVATLVPSFMAGKIFWVYLTGTGMIAAGISFISNIKVKLAGMLLGIMLTIFILLLHIPKLAGHPLTIIWTRAVQDTALAGTAFMLTGNMKLMNAGRLLYAVCLGILGIQHFAHVSFITARVPAYFPLTNLWDYLIGMIMMVAAICIAAKYKLMQATVLSGVFIAFFALLYNVPLLIADVHNGQQWTGFMLDIALSAGAFITLKSFPSINYAASAVNPGY